MSLQPIPVEIVHMIERHLLLNSDAPDGALYSLIGEVYSLAWNHGMAAQTAAQAGQLMRHSKADRLDVIATISDVINSPRQAQPENKLLAQWIADAVMNEYDMEDK